MMSEIGMGEGLQILLTTNSKAVTREKSDKIRVVDKIIGVEKNEELRHVGVAKVIRSSGGERQ